MGGSKKAGDHRGPTFFRSRFWKHLCLQFEPMLRYWLYWGYGDLWWRHVENPTLASLSNNGPPAKANIAAVWLCHQHDQTHKPSAGRDDVVYLPLYICYTYLIIFDVGEDIYSIHIQIFIDTLRFLLSLSLYIYIYIYAACISRELDMDMSLYTSISIYIYRSL